MVDTGELESPVRKNVQVQVLFPTSAVILQPTRIQNLSEVVLKSRTDKQVIRILGQYSSDRIGCLLKAIRNLFRLHVVARNPYFVMVA